MFNKFVLALAVGMSLAGAGFAQSPCSTDEHYHQLLQRHPELAGYEESFRTQLTNDIARRTTAATDTSWYDVPIVVHVIHDYANDYVDDNVIFNAVAYWATVFRKENADTINVITPFKPWIGNPRIRLHLATIDPWGKPTKGIVRTNSYLAPVGDDQAKYNGWPNDKYINIWLVGSFNASHGSAAAYAYYPSSGAAMPWYDGVISRYDYVNYEKTIPHELAHVLAISHVWGSTNSAAVACGDDGIDDTPPTMGHVPGCSTTAVYDMTCAAGYEVTYTSASGMADSVVNYPDTVNSQNIMDYTYCELMFTKGQSVRMRQTLNSSTAGRNNLITTENIAATGALAPRPDLKPIADFTMNKATGVGTVTDKRTYFLAVNSPGNFWFRSTSWNDTISSIKWTFSNGAITDTASSTNVQTRFSVPGWVTVQLEATSNAGTDTLINTHAVYVADTAPAGGMGYAQSFTSAADIANWPMFNYYNNQFKWEHYTGAGYGDNACLRYRSFDTSDRIFGTATGDFDDIYLPAFNLAGVTDSLYLNFYTAGAFTNSGISGWDDHVYDELEIQASNNGGVRWYPIGSYTGNDLGNNGNRSVDFAPTLANQWKPRTVSIPMAYRTYNSFFRLRVRPGNMGNNLYLDNFRITPFRTGVKDVAANPGTFDIYPNPSANGCTLVFKTGSDGMVQYVIKDLAGKTVYSASNTYPANSVQQEIIAREHTPAAGMYFVTVITDGVSMTQKLVVY